MSWEWAFAAGAAAGIAASACVRQALAGAARRQWEADRGEAARMQASLRRMAARCAAAEAENARRRAEAAWQAGVIAGSAMANRRDMRRAIEG